ncbi:MAG TPA: hypothetical protein VFU78_00075 [Thermomicrobiales bacterium]|nr:hypothetical protein [Thermomicrobiales bacterium]
MATTTPDYTLTSDDFAALTAIVKVQADLGATTLTASGLLDVMAQLFNLSYTLMPPVTNTSISSAFAAFLAQLAEVPTGFSNYDVPALWVAYTWGHYVQTDFQDWYYQSVTYNEWAKLQSAPPGPSAWQTSVTGYLATLQPTLYPATPTFIYDIDPGYRQGDWNSPTWAQTQTYSFEYGLFTPDKWTGAGQVKTGAPALWTAQAGDLAATMQATALTDAMCLYLLYLLVGLCTSPRASDLTTVATVANLVTNSVENPNDTFIDQLVYYALMAWVDPRGTYQWTHDQLTAQLQAFSASVSNGDPASQLVTRTLQQQTSVLNSTSSYPMTDPYNPSISFPVRRTDTLAALNQTWATLQSMKHEEE